MRILPVGYTKPYLTPKNQKDVKQNKSNLSFGIDVEQPKAFLQRLLEKDSIRIQQGVKDAFKNSFYGPKPEIIAKWVEDLISLKHRAESILKALSSREEKVTLQIEEKMPNMKDERFPSYNLKIQEDPPQEDIFIKTASKKPVNDNAYVEARTIIEMLEKLDIEKTMAELADKKDSGIIAAARKTIEATERRMLGRKSR